MIHQGAFNDLLALEELDLSYNNLDSIPWEAIQVRISLNCSSISNLFGWSHLKRAKSKSIKKVMKLFFSTSLKLK